MRCLSYESKCNSCDSSYVGNTHQHLFQSIQDEPTIQRREAGVLDLRDAANQRKKVQINGHKRFG